MTPSLRRRTIRRALAGLAAGTMLLTACGDGYGGFTYNTDYGSFGDPDQLLAGAVDITFGVQSFSFDTRAMMSLGTEMLTLNGSGACDFHGMVFDTKVSVAQDDAESVVQLRSDGSTAWISSTDEQASQLPAGLEWVEGDAARIADSETSEPFDMIPPVILLKASSGATKVGREADLEKFTTTVDYGEATEKAGPLAAELEERFSVATEEPVVFDINVWLDDDGVVRKMDLIDKSEDVDVEYFLALDAVDEPVDAPEPPAESTVFSGPEAAGLFDQLVD